MDVMVDLFLKKLFSLNRFSKRLILVSIDIFLIITSFMLAMWLRLDNIDFLINIKPWLTVFMVIPATIFLFMWLGLYRAVIRFIAPKALRAVVIGSLVSANLMFFLSQLFLLEVPRSVPFIYLFLILFSIAGSRFFIRNLYSSRFSVSKKPIAIYGAGGSGRQLLDALNQNSEYLPTFFIDDDPKLQGCQISGLNVYSFKKASLILEDFDVKIIFLTMPKVSSQVRLNIINQLESFPLEIKSTPRINDLITGNLGLNEIPTISIEELLGRDPVPEIPELIKKNIKNKVVLVTGAGGSIGSELCKQIIHQNPKKLILLDISEYALYQIQQITEEIMRSKNYCFDVIPIITSVQKEDMISNILEKFSVQTVYHAAAYKHVPLVEQNIIEGISNNVLGTYNLLRKSIQENIETFVLISTDKAVRPTNYMGASKRLAEIICQSYSHKNHKTNISIVRFGNVLGSSGSVVPKFREQISNGGPLTVTHKDINRYFMTIEEAAQLVIQAGAMSKRGDVFILDMGSPIKILDLAKKMILLHGFTPTFSDSEEKKEGLINIKISGLRPGEKLYEELSIEGSPIGTIHPRIMEANESLARIDQIDKLLEKLITQISNCNLEQIKKILMESSIDFSPAINNKNDTTENNSKLPESKKIELKIVKNN